MKYAFIFVFLFGCDWAKQEQVAEDVVETIVKDEIGVDLKAPQRPTVELRK